MKQHKYNQADYGQALDEHGQQGRSLRMDGQYEVDGHRLEERHQLWADAFQLHK